MSEREILASKTSCTDSDGCPHPEKCYVYCQQQTHYQPPQEQLPSKQSACDPPFTMDRYGSLAECITAERNWLQLELARYENGRVVLLGEIEELKKKLSERLQQIDDLKQLAVRQGNEIRKLRAGERA